MSAVRQVWWAGLGAFSALAAGARQAADQVGRWAEKGRPLAEQRRAAAAGHIHHWNARIAQVVDDAGTLLRETAEYEGRRLVKRFGIATTEDLNLLAAHLEALDRKLDAHPALRRLAAQPTQPTQPAELAAPAAPGAP